MEKVLASSPVVVVGGLPDCDIQSQVHRQIDGLFGGIDPVPVIQVQRQLQTVADHLFATDGLPAYKDAVRLQMRGRGHFAQLVSKLEAILARHRYRIFYIEMENEVSGPIRAFKEIRSFPRQLWSENPTGMDYLFAPAEMTLPNSFISTAN